MIPDTIPKLDITAPVSGEAALTFIAIGVICLAVLVVALSIGVFTHHLVTDRERRRNRQRFEGASLTLAPHLVAAGADLERHTDEACHHYGARAVALVLRRARYDLKGSIVDRITRLLERIGEVDFLLRDVRSRRDWKRAIAVRGLGECGGEKARAALIVAANDPAGEVRRAAREGLLSDGSPDALKAAIESFLIDLPRRAGWRRTFYARLAAVSSNELLTLVTSGRLSDGEEKLALEALGDAGCRHALPLAVQRASAEEPETRATAIRVIGKLGSDREVPLLFEALEDPEWFVRAAAGRALEWMLLNSPLMSRSSWESTAFLTLGRKLTDNSWWVRANAARALARGGGGGVRVLLETANGVDAYARDAAVAALAMAPLTPDTRLQVKKLISNLVGEGAGAAQIAVKRNEGLFA